MQPTLVHAGVMDSQKPPLEFTLPVKHLNGFDRFRRGLLRMLMISIPGALITIIPPHPCGMFIALDEAVFSEGAVTCPKCAEPLPLPAKLTGWPARFSCPKCKAMIEIRMPAKERTP